MALENAIFRLSMLLARLNALDVKGLSVGQSYSNLVSALQESGANPDFLEVLIANAESFDGQTRYVCSECGQTDLPSLNIGVLCAHKVLCSACSSAGKE